MYSFVDCGIGIGSSVKFGKLGIAQINASPEVGEVQMKIKDVRDDK